MNTQSAKMLPCLCANFRRATRSLTQLYDAALRPLGLRATQFTVLQALSLAGEIRQRELGELLGMDTTTLTRTLEIMGRKCWVARRSGKDKRERWLSLAKEGEVQFRSARPYWEKVQARLRSEFGNERWDELMKLANEVTNSVKQGEPQ